MAKSISPTSLTLLSLGLLACSSGPRSEPTTTPSKTNTSTGNLSDEPSKAQIQTRKSLSHPLALGLSGSCERGEEVFLVAERNHILFRLSPDGQLKEFAIEGVPKGLELEGLACGLDRIYVSTESGEDGRLSDPVLVLALDETRAEVVDTIEMQYPQGLTADDNHGLEGLCLAGDTLVAAAELSQQSAEGIRQAPILTTSISGGPTQVAWVSLTSDTGKISGIDCHSTEDAIEIFAIERHFGVARILRFQIGHGDQNPQQVLPLESILGESDNFEAILVSPKGEIRLYNDNHYKTITGPSEEVSLVPDANFSY